MGINSKYNKYVNFVRFNSKEKQHNPL